MSGGNAKSQTRSSTGTDVPVSVATSDTSDAMKRRLLELPVDGFLAKPLSQDSLLRAIGEILIVRNQSDQDQTRVEQSAASEGLVDSFVRDLQQVAVQILDRRTERDGGDDSIETACGLD